MEDVDFSVPELLSGGIAVRPGEMDDVALCSQLDGSYNTHYVWQMNLKESEYTLKSLFNRVRLPRVMPVMYPFSARAIWAMLQKASYLLVAELHEQPVGFACGALLPWRKTLTIDALIVSPEVRRQRVGTSLVGAVQLLAQTNDCAQIAVSLQTKNDPAITFARKKGAVLCGYDDHLFPNGDIALLFSLSV